MAINDFLTFAADPAANVMTQTNYIASGFTARLLGFSTGTALSVQLNKVWRQASLISSMIGQFTVDEIGQDMLDDGSPGGLSALQQHFRLAVTHVAQGAIGVGYLPLTGGSLSGPLVINAGANQLTINASSGQWASATMSRQAGMGAQLVAYTTINPRWAVTLATPEPEVGSNAGSNFSIASFNDAGAYLDTPLSITRATGVVNFSHSPTVNGALLPYLPIIGGTLTGNLGVGGVGINYPQIGGNFATHRTAFGWDNSFIIAAVDGTYIGQLATVGWTQGFVGNYLPLTGGTLSGGLTINAGLVVGAASGFRSTVWFANLGDFINFWDGRFRFRQWAGSWYDAWDGQTGLRVWSSNTQWIMTLDPGGTLALTGNLRASGGRIISILGNGPSVCCYATIGVAKGMWVDGSGLWLGQMDGSGNPTRGDMLLDNGGYTTVYASGQCNGNWWVGNGTVTAAQVTSNNMSVAGTIYTSYETVYGNLHANGDVFGNTHTSNYTRCYGQTDIDTYCNVGAWMTAGAVHSRGVAEIDGACNVHGHIHCTDWRIIVMGGEPSFCAWSQSNGVAMGFWVSNQMNFGYMDGEGGPTSALGAWANNGFFSLVPVYYPSDPSLKDNIREADDFDSLNAIVHTPLASFDWKASGEHVELGLLASDLQARLPGVVMENGQDDMEPYQFVDQQALIAHLFRAVRQLNDKIERMAHV